LEKINLFRKVIVDAVIFLFIGLSFALSINANIRNEPLEDEMVKITTELFGIKGVKTYYVTPINFNEENWVKEYLKTCWTLYEC
jgi:hypothetical protein